MRLRVVVAHGRILFCSLRDKLSRSTTITKRMVAELIQYIEVYPAVKEDGITNQRVTIHYNCIGAFEVRIAGKSPSGTFFWKREKA